MHYSLLLLQFLALSLLSPSSHVSAEATTNATSEANATVNATVTTNATSEANATVNATATTNATSEATATVNAASEATANATEAADADPYPYLLWSINVLDSPHVENLGIRKGNGITASPLSRPNRPRIWVTSANGKISRIVADGTRPETFVFSPDERDGFFTEGRGRATIVVPFEEAPETVWVLYSVVDTPIENGRLQPGAKRCVWVICTRIYIYICVCVCVCLPVCVYTHAFSHIFPCRYL